MTEPRQPVVSDAPHPEPTLPGPADPPISPFAGLPTRAGSVVRVAFDLLTRANAQLRDGSFYVGLIVVGMVGPVVLLVWGIEVVFAGQDVGVEAIMADGDGVGGWVIAASWLAMAGFVIAFVESRGVAMAVLGARLAGRPLDLRDAVERSRRVFWRVLGAILLVNVPLVLVQYLVGSWLVDVLHGPSEVSALTPSIVAAVLGTPFAYVLAGIVLGDVGVFESARRSVTLFSARRRAALVVSLFALAAQLLTVVGLLVGLDLVFRLFDALGLGPAAGGIGVAVTTALVIVVVFAAGTLLFTVAALAVAPQVMMFLALTHATPGLDRIHGAVVVHSRESARSARFRWLTRPMLLAIALGAVAAAGGLAALND